MDENGIREIVEGKLGLTSMEAYWDYKRRIGKEGISLEDINLLSPDTINSGSFWKYCAETPQWTNDTISFGTKPDDSVSQVNANNFMVGVNHGIFSHLLAAPYWITDRAIKVLDIGAGRGMLLDFLKRHVPNCAYLPLDVHPRFDGVLKVEDCNLPPVILGEKFDFVFSVNVFQHLSVRQRRKYYEQVVSILDPRGFFVLTMVAEGKMPGFKCKENGKSYIVHYGQFTEIQTYEELIADLTTHFYIHTVTHVPAIDGFGFHLRLKVEPQKIS